MNPLSSPLSRPIAEIAAHYDVIVVGSGYGGGVAASRLARAGRRVCLLERGREIATGDFPSRFPELRGAMQMSGSLMRVGSPSALFDFRVGADMHVLVGCGLGGGSLINAGVALRPDDRVFEDPAWPAEISGDGLLDEGFRRATRWLRPASDPGATTRTKYKALARASHAVEQQPQPADVAVSFADNKNPAGVQQPACTLCGDCCSGCNVGAKNTIALTYLPDAANHGADIFTGAKVHHLARHGDRWQVFWQPTENSVGGKKKHLECLSADIVILAAGTLGSTEIMLRTRQDGLAVSETLGRSFSANGDIIALGYGADARVNAIGVGHPPKVDFDTVGATVSGQIELSDSDDLAQGMYIQEGALPSVVAPLLPVLFVPGGRLLGAAQSLIKGVYKGPLANLHTFFVVSHDSASGQLQLDDDRLALHWPGVEDEPVFERVDAMLTALVEANGADYIKNPLATTPIGAKPATAHPLGGCGMGVDRNSGVIDHKGRVFDANASNQTITYDGLYISDGSIMPRSLGCNPLYSITAITERAMMHIATDRGWSFDPG